MPEVPKSKVLVSGSADFIGGYVVAGIDNYSKYGRVVKSYDDHPAYSFTEGDVRDTALMTRLLEDCDHFIAGAALIGGISSFHTYAYDLIAANERIIASSCDAAIDARRAGGGGGGVGKLRTITYLSSSMVFESTDTWPSIEGDERKIAVHDRAPLQLRRHRRDARVG